MLLEQTTTQPAPTEQQPYYIPTVPAEPPAKHPGMVEGIISIVCAVLSLAFFPIILGPVGIILGSLSHKKGSKTLGLVAIILSAVFMVAGFIIAFLYLSQGSKEDVLNGGAVILLNS